MSILVRRNHITYERAPLSSRRAKKIYDSISLAVRSARTVELAEQMLKDYKFERKEFYNRRKRRDGKQKWLGLDSLLATLFTVTSSESEFPSKANQHTRSFPKTKTETWAALNGWWARRETWRWTKLNLFDLEISARANNKAWAEINDFEAFAFIWNRSSRALHEVAPWNN